MIARADISRINALARKARARYRASGKGQPLYKRADFGYNIP